jgi:hypothetical protein
VARADTEAAAPVIVERVRKRAHGHHGGSWKVAFADFATAMMAFFLLMWLMGRALVGGGLPAAKIGRVVGLASSVLLDPSAPDGAVNRRISIVVMNKRTEAAISQENGTLLRVQHTDTEPRAASFEAPAVNDQPAPASP